MFGGVVTGHIARRTFRLASCPECGFAFIADPLADFAGIYTEDYYSGRGADPLVNYVAEALAPERTIRRYEWRGVLKAVAELTPITGDTKWLDLGCGLGGLVTYLRDRGIDAVGADEGWGASWCKDHGVPLVDAATTTERFDVITSIEVIEHVPDPLGFLRQVARLLRPGGLFWLTTGNAVPWRGRLDVWPYVIPEIHVSFFEPRTMAQAMARAGLEHHDAVWTRGHPDIIRFKVLKNLRRNRTGTVERLIPWSFASCLVERRYGALQHPYARSPRADAPAG